MVERAKRLQDVVGEHQDAVVAEERLRALSEPATALLVGRLIERQRARRPRRGRGSEGVAEARQDDPMIRAAGGIIVRDGNVLIVHRPKYGDWSLPKGKCKSGESDEACALREIEEETGLDCEIERPLGETLPGARRTKVVTWFLMRPLEGEFTPSDEIDEIAWAPTSEVHDRLTFDVGVEQLRAALVDRGGASRESAPADPRPQHRKAAASRRAQRVPHQA